jgi:hypothetical protein
MKRRLFMAAALVASVTAAPGCSLFTSTGSATPSPPSQEGPGERRGGTADRDSDFEPYDEVITEDAITREGLFKTHRVDDDLFYEIPDSLYGREMLLIGRPVENSAATGFFGGGPRMIVQWERQGDRVVLREKEYGAVADPSSAIWRQVAGMRKGPIVGAFDIETLGPDSSAVVDVTDLYTTSNDQMGSIEGLQRDLSWIEHVAAFPRNIEVEATQTGRVRRPGPASPFGGGNNQIPATMRMHWSMLLLPDEPMRPRLYDKRVGWITSRYTDYGRPEHRAEERRFLHRFRLEPRDTAAFRRGDLVEPVEPIVYWIDPATPEWLKPWVKQGVDAWNVAFEDAGFRNAIRGEFAPADDEDWSLIDARHSVIYWRPSPVANATGGQTVDPRSGQILKGEVNMYHNVQNLLRNWYFTQVSPVDERARQLPLPDSLMGRMVEYVVTHEVGHSIGFPHNMKASAMYPVDSLRSADFLRRMGGHVSTLMDYSRFNYVAQPEDDIPPELLIPQVGPYDKFAVRWGYRPILDVETPDDEREILDRWARVQDTVPWFRFTTSDSPNDPANLTEAVGDENAVRASQLGLLNLERVMASLIDVAERPGEDYELLDELYGNVVSQWGRYMRHVAAAVGGANTQEKYGTGIRFEPVSRERQAAAVAFLNEQAFETPEMFIDPAILRRIEAEGIVDRMRAAQSGVLGVLINPFRFGRLVEYEALAGDPSETYTVADLMADLRQGVWSELDDSQVRVDVYRRNLQRAYLEAVNLQLHPPEEDGPSFGPEPPEPHESDVRPVLRGELVQLKARVDRAATRSADAMTRMHLRDVSMEIDRILDPSG